MWALSSDWQQRLRRWRELCVRLVTDDRKARGIKLLREWLSPSQLAQFDTGKYFDVIGCHTGKRYRIRYASSMNVIEIDDLGRPKAGWCFIPDCYLVPGDIMLAQKIALELFESNALKVAHHVPPRDGTFAADVYTGGRYRR